VTPAPRLSVILPVYNGEPWLREAIDSVLSQSFSDFELLAFNDGSTDGSAVILDSYSDPRLKVIHQANAGLAVTLNRGVQMARGELIARQDADDISLPGRFERQCAWMDQHPAHVLIGGRSRILEGERETTRGHAHPESNAQLQLLGLFDSYFVHSAVMFRRQSALDAGNYPIDPQRNPPEDFDLWSRLALRGKLANLPEEVLLYREVPGSISRAKSDLISQRGHAIAVENVCRVLGMQAIPAICDLVSAMRLESHRLSSKVSWSDVQAQWTALVERMVQRFPDEAAELQAHGAQLRHRITRMRWQMHPCGKPILNSVLRVTRLLKRVFK